MDYPAQCVIILTGICSRYIEIITKHVVIPTNSLMSDTRIGLCEIELYLPGVLSLKEKRSILRALLARIRKSYNVSAAEIGHLDTWQSAKIALVVVSNSNVYSQQTLQKMLAWIEEKFPQVSVVEYEIELL